MMRSSLLLLLICLLSCGVREATGAQPWSFQYIGNLMGPADRQGYVSIWWHASRKIEVNEGVELPIRFLFHSQSGRYMANSCLGEGWWFPILESTLAPSDESTILMSSPGGFAYFLYPDAKEPGTYWSPERRLVCKQLAGGAFEVKDVHEGWAFRYTNGLLLEATTPAGDQILWIHEKARVTKIISKKKGDLLLADYNAVGLLRSLVICDSKYTMEFTHSKVPSGAEITPSSTEFTLSEVRDSDSFASKNERILYPERGATELKVNCTRKIDGLWIQDGITSWRDDEPKQLTYTWDSKTGHILSDSTYKYEVTRPDPYKYAHSKIVRTDAGGIKEIYWYDCRTGKAEEVEADGSIVTTSFDLRHGPTYGYATSSFKKPPSSASEQDPVRQYEAKYDEKGRIAWEFRDGDETSYTYNNEGKEALHPTEGLTKKKDGSTTHIYYRGNNNIQKVVRTLENGLTQTDYYNEQRCITRRESSDGTWETVEYYKPGLPSKNTHSSGRVHVTNYGPDDKIITKYTNGKLVERRVNVEGKEYLLHWTGDNDDPFDVHAVEDAATGDILSEQKAAKILEAMMP